MIPYCAACETGTVANPPGRWMPYDGETPAMEPMETNLIPNFTYEDETNLLCLAALGLAHAKELAETNHLYWNDRKDAFEAVLNKLQVEVRNSYTLK